MTALISWAAPYLVAALALGLGILGIRFNAMRRGREKAETKAIRDTLAKTQAGSKAARVRAAVKGENLSR